MVPGLHLLTSPRGTSRHPRRCTRRPRVHSSVLGERLKWNYAKWRSRFRNIRCGAPVSLPPGATRPGRVRVRNRRVSPASRLMHGRSLFFEMCPEVARARAHD